MTTTEKISQTKSFKAAYTALQSHLISPASIAIVENALEMKDAGCSYIDWLKETSAGFAYKAVVKELF